MKSSILFAIFFAATLPAPTFAQPTLKLTLREAEEVAVKNHPQVGAARLNALAAGEVPNEYRAAKYPNLSMSLTGVGAPDNTRIAAGGLNNPTILSRAATGLSVSQLLLDFGRTNNLIESAALRAQAADQTVAATRAQLILQVDRAYFLALRAQAVQKVAEQTVAARQLVVDQVEALKQSGLKSGLDLSIASYNLAEARLMLAKAMNDVKAAYAELSTALGSDEDQSFDLAEEPVPTHPLPPMTEAVAEGLSKRPELGALQFERDAARQFLKAEKSLRMPTVSAVWSAGFTPLHDSKLGGTYNAVGINISIPIFNGRLFKAREAEADYRAKASEQNLRTVENIVARDVRLAWLNANTASQRVSLAAQLLSRANEALDLAQERYKLGLSSIVELSQAQLNVTVAEIESANARYEYLLQRATLKYQSGAAR